MNIPQFILVKMKWENVMAFKLPETKMFHSVSEVSDLLDIKPHVIRNWETEFSQLQPRKNKNGVRLFRQQDIKILRSLRRLIFDEGFTIDGARQRLTDGYNYQKDEKDQLKKYKRRVYRIKKELNDLLEILEQKPEN